MVFTRFSVRSTIISDNNLICNNRSVLQCPQVFESIVLALVLIAFIILAWKVCCYNRRKKTTGESNSKEDHHHPPYPQPPSEIYEATKNLGPNSSTSTLVDPYLITNSFNNSLISQDDSFKRMEMPEPVLKWKESVNHSAFNLPMQKVAQPFELDSTTIKLHDDDNKESIPSNFKFSRPASPPPAYVLR